MDSRIVPASQSEDSDDVVVALETARVEEERGEPMEAARWLQRAAVEARKQSRPDRAGELSRAAAQLSRRAPGAAQERFERRPDEQQILSDVDDFADETIVEDQEKLTRTRTPVTRIGGRQGREVIATGTTPVAPLVAESKRAAATERTDAEQRWVVRVAVKHSPSGHIETRLLPEGQQPDTGEQEALLVATRPGQPPF